MAPTLLSSIPPQPLEWLWFPRLPLGMLSLLVGDPGLGKTTLAADLIARVSTRSPWPDGASSTSGSSGVLWLTCEDPVAQVLVPRVHAAGADLSQIAILEKMPDGARPNLRKHAAALRELITQRAPALLVIDPLNAYLGSTKVYEDQEVRSVLEPLVTAAAVANTAVLCLMHLTKDDSRRLLYRVQGSIGFVGVARAVFCVEETDNAPQCRLRCLKANLAPRNMPSLLYHIEQAPGGALQAVWEGIDTAPPPDETVVPQYAPHREEAEDFLRDLLVGPVERHIVLQQGGKQGFTPWVLRIARKRIGAISERTGFPSRTVWRMP